MSESEPTDNVSKVADDIKIEWSRIHSRQVLRKPVYWQYGTRHAGGMTFIQAILRNKGSWMTMLRESLKMRSIKGKSIKASFSGGPDRSSVEAPVIGVERRVRAILFYKVFNSNEEEESCQNKSIGRSRNGM